jgi:chromosome segregation ATPase
MSNEMKIIEERLSQLVTMVGHLRTEQQAFKERMEEGFEAVNLRLDKVEQRLDKVEQRLDKVEQRLDKVEQRLDKVEQRLDKAEPLLVEIKEATNFLSHKTGEHDKDIFVLKRYLPSQSL